MEGPSLVILTEELSSFLEKKVIGVTGNTKQDISEIPGQTISAIKSWGKHLLIQLDSFTVKIHFLMFGSYRINERRENKSPRLSLEFEEGEINFYSCSVQFIEQSLSDVYDWRFDIMSASWNEKEVIKKVKQEKESQVCDVLMDQNIFAGVGNIIKNEVLFNLQLHPESIVGNLPLSRIKALVKESRDYSFNFYHWKKKYELRKHWRVYKKRKCPRCNVPLIIRKTGKGQRGSFFCGLCQAKR